VATATKPKKKKKKKKCSSFKSQRVHGFNPDITSIFEVELSISQDEKAV
jgi:hypothetical protein